MLLAKRSYIQGFINRYCWVIKQLLTKDNKLDLCFNLVWYWQVTYSKEMYQRS